jgi:hypothetical protein
VLLPLPLPRRRLARQRDARRGGGGPTLGAHRGRQPLRRSSVGCCWRLRAGGGSIAPTAGSGRCCYCCGACVRVAWLRRLWLCSGAAAAACALLLVGVRRRVVSSEAAARAVGVAVHARLGVLRVRAAGRRVRVRVVRFVVCAVGILQVWVRAWVARPHGAARACLPLVWQLAHWVSHHHAAPWLVRGRHPRVGRWRATTPTTTAVRVGRGRALMTTAAVGAMRSMRHPTGSGVGVRPGRGHARRHVGVAHRGMWLWLVPPAVRVLRVRVRVWVHHRGAVRWWCAGLRRVRVRVGLSAHRRLADLAAITLGHGRPRPLLLLLLLVVLLLLLLALRPRPLLLLLVVLLLLLLLCPRPLLLLLVLLLVLLLLVLWRVHVAPVLLPTRMWARTVLLLRVPMGTVLLLHVTVLRVVLPHLHATSTSAGVWTHAVLLPMWRHAWVHVGGVHVGLWVAHGPRVAARVHGVLVVAVAIHRLRRRHRTVRKRRRHVVGVRLEAAPRRVALATAARLLLLLLHVYVLLLRVWVRHVVVLQRHPRSGLCAAHASAGTRRHGLAALGAAAP